MKNNSRTIKEDIIIIKRGIREFDKILPGQMILLAVRSAVTAFTPYIAIMMSALILNELVGDKSKTRLMTYVLISIGATLLLSCIECRMDKKISIGYSRLFSTHEIILTDKAYRIPFFLLEKESTRSLREQVSGSISLSGAGMASLYWDMEVVVKNLCSAGTALVLGLGFAHQVAVGVCSDMISGSTAAAILFLLAALVAGCSYITCKIASRRFDVSFEVFEHGAKFNRYGEFYDLNYLPDEDMAMDIRIFRQKQLILHESRQKCYQRLADGNVRETRAVNKLDATKILCAGICGAAVYIMVGFLANRNVIGIGNVIMISSAVTMLITALSELAQIITDLRNNNVHLLNFFTYMDLEEETDETPKGTIYSENTAKSKEIDSVARESAKSREQCEIIFDKVSFCYPHSQKAALQDISLRIAPGEKLAIVGENGSGKTTLIKLLCRLYQPTEGRILLNGKDIQNYPYGEYIRKIATVFQDFALFAFSIAENVAASKDYDAQRVYEALCRADLQEKVDTLSKGITQTISHDYEEDGINLSGGESQKTAIARAIYKEAPIVILDEPTAALDPYAEKEIYEQFFKNLSGETMLSISHRLSSCRFCGRIIVLHGGRLVQQGTHEELLAQPDGKYARLWEMQAQYYT